MTDADYRMELSDEDECVIAKSPTEGSGEEPVPRWPDFERPPDPRLVAEGWERRFMADSQRLNEFMDLYTSMGYEVRAEPVRPEEIGPECGDCRLVLCRLYFTLYTRKQWDARL